MLQRKLTYHYDQNLLNNWRTDSNDNKNKDPKGWVTEEETIVETYK